VLGGKNIIKLFLLFFIVGVGFSQDQKTFRLKSGDKITGQVMSEAEDTITIINPLMGEVVLKKSDLKQESVIVSLKSGDVVRGELLSQENELFVVQTSFGDISIPSDQIEKIDSGDSPAPVIQQTPYGVQVAAAPTQKEEEWFFSKERLMDVWFDPTGFIIEKNTLYLSGLSWGFGVTDKIQVTSKWTNYFFQDFNLRPKMTLFQGGNVESQSSFAVGAHFHTRGLPSKYKWVEDANRDWHWDDETGDEYYTTEGGYIRLGAQKSDGGDDDWENYRDSPSDGDQFWGETFAAYTVSKLRASGNGRINTTVGASATFYPGEDIAPRLYAAVDIDVTPSVKVMSEVFYDAQHPEFIDLMEGKQNNNALHFDVGFMTNKIPLLWIFGQSDNLWIGYHFQRPFISFYWKI